MGENSLIEDAKSGNKEALERLIEKYAPLAFNLSLKLMRNYDDASDAAQEALIKVYSSIKKFKGKSLFSTWVYRITYNTCIDLQRKRKNNIIYEPDETIKDPKPLPYDEALSNEKKENIKKAINALPDKYRAAVVLRDIMGSSYDEVAEILRCPVGTVKSRISRGRDMLKEMLSEYMEQITPN
ncbi:MAG: sigma-70 family RNA polymerase sigma factor [Firmicutes bacterium]|nr:sigma-70 family RNA polymerase sigma factor [Bacillota bacterium]